MSRLSSSCWLTNGTVGFKTGPHNITTSFQWDLLDKLAAFVLPADWHCHGYCTCLLYKGVSLPRHLNMVCGYATSNRMLQRQCTHVRTLRLTPGPLRRCQLVFFLWQKISQLLNSQQVALFSSYSVKSSSQISPQKATNTVAAGCGGTDPIKHQCTLRNLTKPQVNLVTQGAWCAYLLCVWVCVRSCLESN